MTHSASRELPIRAGDVEGLGRVYSEFGGPLLRPQETALAQRNGCDIAVFGSWRVFFAKEIFHPLPGNPSGTIHVTSDRLIFLRDIDVWKEVKPLLTPLGLPTAAEKESKLKRLKAKGARQYCEIFPAQLQLVRVRRKPRLLQFRLSAKDGGKYVLFVYTDKDDPHFFDVLEAAVAQRSPRRTAEQDTQVAPH